VAKKAKKTFKALLIKNNKGAFAVLGTLEADGVNVIPSDKNLLEMEAVAIGYVIVEIPEEKTQKLTVDIETQL
jgi:hypothetical protein